MVKRLLFLLFLLLTFIFPRKVSAQRDFYVDAEFVYEVTEAGDTVVTANLNLENANDELFAKGYTLKLNSINPKNVTANYQGREMEIVKNVSNDSVDLYVEFNDVVVGIGTQRDFVISFEESSFADKTGEVWEISIPRVENENSFRNYSAILVVPKSLGDEAFVSPLQKNYEEDEIFRRYTFAGRGRSDAGINAAFGEFQVFSFTLTYHLENPLKSRAFVEIALPPDTAFQRVYYEQIEPKPSDIVVDSDGNWLATYNLRPRARVDVNVSGSVQIFSSPRTLSVAQVFPQEYYLSSSQYWQAEDPVIKALADDLVTPKRIYEYVSNNLTYDYDRVRPNVERIGAKGALLNPGSAICMEFTDLFIALSRAAGIPAREINGFAYTENPEIQPLSLVADVLHSWPEYWDEKGEAWIPVDPTWASTTGGVDYFSKLDLRHFTFVIHGISATTPYSPGSYKLGTNPQKDVYVSFGRLPNKKNSEIEISAKKGRSLPFLSNKIFVTLRNSGPVALYDIHPQALFDGIVSQEDFISVLPPYATYETEIVVPYSLLGKNTPQEVKIIAESKEVIVPTSKGKIVILNLTTLTLILITVTLILLNRMGKFKVSILNLSKPISKIKHRAKSIKSKKA